MPAQGLPDSLECSNFIFLLLASNLMGKSIELIQNPFCCNFYHSYYTSYQKDLKYTWLETQKEIKTEFSFNFVKKDFKND